MTALKFALLVFAILFAFGSLGQGNPYTPFLPLEDEEDLKFPDIYTEDLLMVNIADTLKKYCQKDSVALMVNGLPHPLQDYERINLKRLQTFEMLSAHPDIENHGFGSEIKLVLNLKVR